MNKGGRSATTRDGPATTPVDRAKELGDLKTVVWSVSDNCLAIMLVAWVA